MCGIFGFHGFENKDLLDSMQRCMSHRGPDENGTYVDDNISLGNNRLSIVGLGNGKQPIHNEDETVQVVYNGEIFNYKGIKKDLQEKGHDFYTDADTEILVHLYEEEGIEMVKRLRGMFVFALWDEEKEKLFLARDRMGQKPLHYTETSQGLVFASEIKSILEHHEVEPGVDQQALSDYLTFQYVPSPLTMFEDIKSLPPATIMEVSEEGRSFRQYWDFNFSGQITNENEAVRKLRNRLKESVEMRTMSDVPISAYLSGGLDSSTVVGILSEIRDDPVTTFSVGFNEPNDETDYAREVADYHNTNHNEIIMEEDSLSMLEDIIYSIDQPIADAGIIPSYVMAEKVSEKAKVVLSGDGSDEMWAGYPKYRTMPFVNKHRKKVPQKFSGAVQKLKHKLPEMGRPTRYLEYISQSSEKELYLTYLSVFDKSEKQEVLDYRYEDAGRRMEKAFSEETNLMERMLKFDLTYLLPDDFLMKVDKTTMAHSVEPRSPFVDHKLVELGSRIHPSLKMKGKNEKYILKQAAKPFVPESVIKRKKKGFQVPYTKWLERSSKHYNVEERISQLQEQKHFTERGIRKVNSKSIQGNKNTALKKWALFNYSIWHEKFIQ